MKKPPLLLTLGLVLLLSSLTGLLWLDLPLRNGERLTFTTAVNDTLAATYHPGTTDVGVLLLPGFGSDQHMLRSLTRELVRRDVPVLTIDYSGHGRAPGALTFDNAETDRLAGQVQAAMETLQEKSGLPADQIHWIGHSLGARVAVQSSVLGPTRPGGLILYGAQINLGTNAQSEFFTGTADSDLAWVQSLGQQTPPVPILLLSGAWEDILPVEAAQLLMTQLCGTAETACDGPLAREWRLYPRLVHNYEIYAPRLIADTIAELGLRNAERSGAGMRIGLWAGTAVGLFTTLLALLQIVPPTVNNAGKFKITRPGRFVAAKYWLWLPALPLVLLVMTIYVLIPLPNPTFNLIYGGFLGGYGLLLGILQWRGWMPGTTGKLSRSGNNGRPHGLALAIGFNLLFFLAVTIFYRSGLGMAPPVGVRLLWVLIFTPLTAVGFALGALEYDALRAAAPQKPGLRLLAGLSGLVPFVIYGGLLGILGSTSGLIGAAQGIGVLLLSLLQGEVTRRVSGRPWLAATLQSILIYWLILPSGALFTPIFG